MGFQFKRPALGHDAEEDPAASGCAIAEAREIARSQEEALALVDSREGEARLAVRRVEQTRASSSSTRSTRSPSAPGGGRGRTCRGKASSATSCRSSKARPSRPSTGPVATDHVLFIAAGRLPPGPKPSDLIPELQGRFPIRVELSSLARGTTSSGSSRSPRTRSSGSIRSSARPPRAPDLRLRAEDGIAAIAEVAATVNERSADIGARSACTP